MRRWNDFAVGLVLFASANRLSYQQIAPIFGVSRAAIAGVVHRARHVYTPKAPPPRKTAEYHRNRSFWIDSDMDARIEAQRMPGQNSSQLLRDIIAAGLEVMETGE